MKFNRLGQSLGLGNTAHVIGDFAIDYIPAKVSGLCFFPVASASAILLFYLLKFRLLLTTSLIKKYNSHLLGFWGFGVLGFFITI